jgi:leucyl aminopeptidase
MDFTHIGQIEKRKNADGLVLPYWKDKQKVQPAFSLKGKWPNILNEVLATEDFKGKEGETLFLYVEGQPEKRFCLLGLGAKDKASVETLRRSYGGLAKACLSKRMKSLNLVIPELDHINENELIKGVAEGLFLPNYTFNRHKHREPDDPEDILLQSINWIGLQPHILDAVKEVHTICEAVYFTRDLVNECADIVTPQYLAECAKDMANKHSVIKATIFDKKRIEKEKMGLLLAVNRGSAIDPAFIILEYQGNPNSLDKTVLVGKGVTYDTGGLNLKPTGGMETMKCDMAGAAVCLGTMLAASQLKLPVNLTIVIPTTENGIDAKSFKPGDVYHSYAGKTVEMTNSDAEGRLILADALAYAVKNLQPTRLIDLATLTGAIEIALGSEAAGMMSTNDELAQGLLQAGEATFERLWRMPLFDDYKERLKSDIADLKSWNGRSAAANVAATFLRQFVKDSIPWAHIDIAATAYVSEAKKYLPKFGTGYGIRLLIEFLQKLAELGQGQKEPKQSKKKSKG